jgi:hypothetical protein
MSSNAGSFDENQVIGRQFGEIVSRGRFPGETFPGGNRAVARYENLGGLLTGARAQLNSGGVEVAVHRLRRDAQS